MNAVSKEELSKGEIILRVGDLKKMIADLPDDVPVFVEHVDDAYFKGGHDISGIQGQLEDGSYGILPDGSRSGEWPVLLRESQSSCMLRKHNEDVDSCRFLDKEDYPVQRPSHTFKYTEEHIIESMTPFSSAHCCTVDKEKDAVYIHLHY